MSSRVLRKLQGDKDFANDCSDPDSELEGTGGAKKKQLNVNRYDLVRRTIFIFSSFKCLMYSS
jgi:hypothetical protein